MQWLQDSDQSNAGYLNNVGHGASRLSGTKRRNI